MGQVLPAAVKAQLLDAARAQGYLGREDIEDIFFYCDIPPEEDVFKIAEEFCIENKISISTENNEVVKDITPLARLTSILEKKFENQRIIHYENIHEELKKPEFAHIQLMEVIISMTRKNITIGQVREEQTPAVEPTTDSGDYPSLVPEEEQLVEELENGVIPASAADLEELFHTEDREVNGAKEHLDESAYNSSGGDEFLWDNLPAFEDNISQGLISRDEQSEVSLKPAKAPIDLGEKLAKIPDLFRSDEDEVPETEIETDTEKLCSLIQSLFEQEGELQAATLFGLYLSGRFSEAEPLEVIIFLAENNLELKIQVTQAAPGKTEEPPGEPAPVKKEFIVEEKVAETKIVYKEIKAPALSSKIKIILVEYVTIVCLVFSWITIAFLLLK
ncbi:hypothetical protein ACFL35_04260 [Candidatus Riflebacteria bacterium]